MENVMSGEQETSDAANRGSIGQKSAPVWPAVIGGVSISLAAMDLYSLGLEVTEASFFGRPSGRMLLPVDQSELVFCLPGIVLALMLLVAGISLIRGGSKAVLHRGYAVFKLIWIGHLTVLAFRGLDDWPPPTEQVVLFSLETLLPAIAYPILLLIWFWRPKVRRWMAR